MQRSLAAEAEEKQGAKARVKLFLTLRRHKKQTSGEYKLHHFRFQNIILILQFCNITNTMERVLF